MILRKNKDGFLEKVTESIDTYSIEQLTELKARKTIEYNSLISKKQSDLTEIDEMITEAQKLKVKDKTHG